MEIEYAPDQSGRVLLSALTIDGESMSVPEWSARSGVSCKHISHRINRGWDPRRAVFTEVVPRRKRPGSLNNELSIRRSMKRRCYGGNNSEYHRDRGVVMCKSWLESRGAFLEDMGPRPPETSIDRIDNDGNYSCGKCEECVARGWPANCRWATPAEQMRNTRHNRRITHAGKTMCLADWSKETGFSVGAIVGRIRRGWSEERALTEPIGTWGVRRDKWTPEMIAVRDGKIQLRRLSA